jgi:Flp pilus assembly protein TadG
MKTQARFQPLRRNPESGVITVVVALLWMTLFGLAAFSVDVGYQYTQKRRIKAAADAAVRAGMPALAADQSYTGQSQAITNATAMATANGFTQGNNQTTVNITANASQLQVQIATTSKTFFVQLFGIVPTNGSATSIGRLTAISSGPALHANGGCGAGGLVITGNAGFVINGDVESNDTLTYATGPTPDTTNGNIDGHCATPTLSGSGTDVITGSGTTGPGPTHADPFLGTMPAGCVGAACFAGFPPCKYGDFLSQHDVTQWIPPALDTLPAGVYCSGGSMSVAPFGVSQVINAAGVTFLALGPITIGANNGGVFSPVPGSPHNIFAMTIDNTDCTPLQAINLGFNNFVMTGSIYAPNGCIRAGSQGDMTLNGSLVANQIFLGIGTTSPGWRINGPGSGGGGGPSWSMFQ